MQRIFVKPEPGFKVWNPKSHSNLPDSGASVEKNTYWNRRLTEGGLELVDESKSVAKKESIPVEKKTVNKKKSK